MIVPVSGLQYSGLVYYMMYTWQQHDVYHESDVHPGQICLHTDAMNNVEWLATPTHCKYVLNNAIHC